MVWKFLLLISIIFIFPLTGALPLAAQNRLERLEKEQSILTDKRVTFIEKKGKRWKIEDSAGKPVYLWELTDILQLNTGRRKLQFSEQYRLFSGFAIGCGGIALFMLSGGIYSLVYQRMAQVPEETNLDWTVIPLMTVGGFFFVSTIPFIILTVIAHNWLPDNGRARMIVEEYNRFITKTQDNQVSIDVSLVINNRIEIAVNHCF